MIYLIGGLLASAFMTLYRATPHRSSPLWTLTLGSSTLTSRLHGKGDKVSNSFALLISFSILFFIAGLRYGIGTDYWARYAPLFTQIKQSDVQGQEIGYVLLNKAVGLATDDYQGIFVVTSFLTIALFYRFFVRMSVNPGLSVFIYVFGGTYLADFNLVKQGLAVAIVVNTFELALRRKNLAFVLMTLLAASFHTSALIWFAVWPLMWIRVSRAWRIAIALAMIGVILVVPQILSALITRFAPSYGWYFDSNYGVTRSIQPVVVVVAVLVFIFCLLVIGKAGEKDRYADSAVNILAVSAAVLVATSTIAYLFNRLNYYFEPAQLIALPLALSLVQNRFARQVMTLLFMIAYLLSFVFQFLVWNAHGVLPYDSIFSR